MGYKGFSDGEFRPSAQTAARSRDHAPPRARLSGSLARALGVDRLACCALAALDLAGMGVEPSRDLPRGPRSPMAVVVARIRVELLAVLSEDLDRTVLHALVSRALHSALEPVTVVVNGEVRPRPLPRVLRTRDSGQPDRAADGESADGEQQPRPQLTPLCV